MVHIVDRGFPLCGFTAEVPAAWPPGNLWVPPSLKKAANCGECLAELAKYEMKRAPIEVQIKEPDELRRVIQELGLTDEERKQYFEWDEYARLELNIAKDMTITGRVLPVKR